MLILKGLIGLHRTVQLQLLQHYWSGHRFGLPWCWMVYLVNEQRSFCCSRDCIQILYLRLYIIDYANTFDCVDHNELCKNLKEMGVPDHLNCLLRNLYAGQEATVRTGYGTTDWFRIGKGICQGCILSPCLFNLLQCTSWEILGWRKHNLESRFPGEI